LETEWLAQNANRYQGRWVALDGDRLLADGSCAKQVFDAIKGYRPIPLVVRIESQTLPFAGW